MSELTNAIERVGRAGSENSRATAKLIAACQTLADHICDEVIGFCVDIPFETNYEKYCIQGTPKYLSMQKSNDDGYGSFFLPSCNWGREECLKFSHDVANGLLDHISHWLESRAKETEEAAIAVESALPTKYRDERAAS